MRPASKIESNLPIGDLTVWDFGFRYNLLIMDISELNVLMIKYEVELRKSKGNEDRSLEIGEILGKIYHEVMRRNRDAQLEIVIQKIAI